MTHSIHVTRNRYGSGGSSGLDEAIAALASGQWGVVERAQLLAAGLSDDQVDYRIAIGRLRGLYPAVYAVGHDRLAPEGHWLAAVFSGGHGAVLSHRSAARLWEFLPWEGPVEVATPMNRRRRKGTRYCRSSLLSFERTVHRGIPVTTVARTLLDLGAVDGRRVPKALEQAEVRGVLDVGELQHLLAEHPRRPGTRMLRAALAAAVGWRGVTRSDLEARFRAIVADAGLPTPAVNCRVDLGSLVIEADAVWHDARLIVELDGYAFHRTTAAFERDRARDRTAVAAGWRVIRITWRQLVEDPAAVVRDLRRALHPPQPE